MATIRKLTFDTSVLPAAGATRKFTILGDPGAVFSFYISNENNRDGTNQIGTYYNFDTAVFQTGFTSLENIKIPSSGVYKKSIVFPSVSDDDQYDIYLVANTHFNTNLSPQLVDKGFIYHVPNADRSTNTDGSLVYPSSVYQLSNKTVTIYVNHDDDSDIKYEADATGSGSATLGTLTIPASNRLTGNVLTITDANGPIIGNIVGCDSSQTLSLTTASGAVLASHIYAQITKVVNGATTSSTSVVLDDVDNLAVGFVLQSTSSGTIPSTKPTITAINTTTKTLTLSAACSLANDATLTFRGYGSSGSNTIQGLTYSFTSSPVKLVTAGLDENYNVQQKVSSEFTTGTNLVLGSTTGIKSGNTINISGLSTDSNGDIITVSSVTNSTTVVLSAAMDTTSNPVVEANTVAFFTGSAQQAIIALTITVDKVSEASNALYLDLTKFLTLTDNF